MLGISDSVIKLVSGVALVLIPIIVYIATEGKIDAAAVGQSTSAISEILVLVKEFLSTQSSEKTASTENTASNTAAEVKKDTASLSDSSLKST
jgi:energy-converting hydrogenase Eha subunit C